MNTNASYPPKASLLVKITALLLILGAAWWFPPTCKKKEPPISGPFGSGILEPFRTPGGSLQTNGITKTEEMRKESGSWFGTTSSGLRLNATYRYEIELRKEWNIYLDEERGIAFVIAPPFSPQLPVAVDSKTVQTWTSSGWGRFDKWEHLGDLQKEMSGVLAAKANSKGYRDLARGDARITVEEFTREWILKNKDWKKDDKLVVKVYFSDEDSIPYPHGTVLHDYLK